MREKGLYRLSLVICAKRGGTGGEGKTTKSRHALPSRCGAISCVDLLPSSGCGLTLVLAEGLS